MAASCSGLWGIRAVQPTDPAPFLAIIGPNRKVNAGEVIDSSRAFYTKILAGESGNDAIRAMNDVVPLRHPDRPERCPEVAEPRDLPLQTFGAINCEDLFLKVLQGYLDQWLPGRTCEEDGREGAPELMGDKGTIPVARRDSKELRDLLGFSGGPATALRGDSA
jgi:hypothetical protein